MRCMTRYILCEFFKVFFVALTGMIFLIVIGVVGQESVRNGLTPLNMMRLIPFALPEALLYAIPATTLFAVCSVYGRIAAENELIAVKALGISPLALLIPTLVASFLVSLVVVGMTDLAVTWGRDGVRRVLLESVEQIVYGTLRTRHSYTGRSFSIHVKDVVGRKLIAPTLNFRPEGKSEVYDCTAAVAILAAIPSENVLRITLYDWQMAGADGLEATIPGKEEFNIPLSDAASRAGVSNRPQDIEMSRLQQEVVSQKALITRMKGDDAAEAAVQLITGDFSSVLADDWEQRETALAQATERLHRLHTEPWRRWAIGFSCSAFVLVGAPLALRMKNSDVWTSFIACFLPILLLYYPLLAIGVGRAKSGELPPYGVWMGNIALAVCGVFLIRRVMRF